ncbi:MAG: efflux RND transporter permease subunit [Deltaproteobacteria bacterium]|nr:efflux RND transporter permease subunit [Deltaproteobacteria bacterium]
MVRNAELPENVFVDARLTPAGKLVFAVSGPLPATEMRELVESVVRLKLLQVPGVMDVELCGGFEPRVRINVDSQRAAALNITIPDIEQAIAAAATPSAGQPVRNIGASGGPEVFRDLVIATRNGAPIRVSELAQVIDDGAPTGCEAHTATGRAIAMYALLRPDYTKGTVESKLAEVGALLPPGVHVDALPSAPMLRFRAPAELSTQAMSALAHKLVEASQKRGVDAWVEAGDEAPGGDLHELRSSGRTTSAQSSCTCSASCRM